MGEHGGTVSFSSCFIYAVYEIVTKILLQFSGSSRADRDQGLWAVCYAIHERNCS